MTLDELALKYHTDKASNGHNYCEIYERYFDKRRNDPIVLLEMGVQFGYSIRLWLEYFPKALVFGVDVGNEHGITDPRYTHFVTSMTNAEFWKTSHLSFDLVVEDASHRARDTMQAFELVWPRVKPSGLYIIEDVQTWWDEWFQTDQYMDNGHVVRLLTGHLNWHGKSYPGKPNAQPFHLTPLETTINFIHCYHGLVIIGKK